MHMRTSWLHSARARFVATVSVVFALVALGGVTAAPAIADVNVHIIVQDAQSGTPLANQSLTFGPTGGAHYGVTTDVSGGFGFGGVGWGDGSYSLVNPNPGIYVDPAPLILDSSVTVTTVSLQRFKVTGSIPADAANGLTTVSIEQNTGSWVAVGSATVNSASGDFEISLPNGAADYRLRFSPSSSTNYVETVSNSFTVGGSVAVFGLGAVTLESARVISGSVFRANGVTPVVGATAYASTGGVDAASAVTDVDGKYRILLPPTDATYTVRVTATGFENQEWNVVTPGSDMVAVNGTAGYVRSGIDFALVGVPVTVSGRVLNYYSLDEQPVIQLYSGGSSPTLVAETGMDLDTGAYSFDNIPAGDYYIKVVPAKFDEYLDTMLGAGNYTEWAKSAAAEAAFASAHAFTVDPTVPSSATGHDVILTDASILIGYLFYSGDGIPGCVLVKNVSDSTISFCAPTDAAGMWFAHVPVGGTYKLQARPDGDTYTSQWWWNTYSESTATPLGPVTRDLFGSYTFYVSKAPATLNVSAVDGSSTDPITVYLYINTGSDWRQVAQADTDPANGDTEVSFTESFAHGTPTGLDDGDYRVRFQRADGTWLAATSFTSGVYPDAVPGTAPACFIDYADLTSGPPTAIAATFTAASASQGCGPQVYSYGEVTGSVVSSSTFGSIDIANHVVTLTSNGTSRTATTASDGSFSFSYVPNGSYEIEVSSPTHTPGGHEYTYTETGRALGNGDVDLGPLVATRLGNAFGQISNWNSATMSGTATLYAEDDCGCWTPTSLTVNIAADGSFEVPGIDVDGAYGVMVEFASTYAPVFIGGGYPTPTDPFTGTAEQDYNVGSVAVDLVAYVTISGRVMFGDQPIAHGGVIAFPDGRVDTTAFDATTDADGYYVLEVAPNANYEVLAIDGFLQLQLQTYNGHNYPLSYFFDSDVMDFDPLEVGASGVADINFALVAADEVTFDIYTSASDNSDLVDVDVHLYQKLAGAWQQIATFASDQDAEAYVEWLGDGDYRLGFSKDGAWLAMSYRYSDLGYPYADDVETEADLSPAQCFYDLTDVKHGTYVYAEVKLVAAPVGSECGAAAPVNVPTPKTTAKHHKPAGPAAAVALTEEPTSTPTPSPTPSATATDEPSDATGVDTPDAASAPDFTWLFWSAGILALLVLAGGAVFMVRRRP